MADFRTYSDPNTPSSQEVIQGPGVTIIVETDGDPDTSVDPTSGALKTETEDGGVVVDLGGPQKPMPGNAKDHDANLALFIPNGERGRISNMLLEAIQNDEESRREWLEMRSKGIDMLGFRLEEPRGDTGASTAPVEGMSTVRHPLLPEAVIRFQSNASAELLPAEGPVKVRDDQPVGPWSDDDAALTGSPGMGHNGGPPLTDPQTGQVANDLTRDDLAEALEKDFNHYLTVTDKGYRSDTDRMLFWVGYGGAGFKKVYQDPIRRMPISRSVDAQDLIVNNAANDIDDAGRITHVIRMRKSVRMRMQLAGLYRDVDLTTPQDLPNPVTEKIAEVQGFNAQNRRQEDTDFTIYECYCELNIEGFEHKDEDGHETGLELPYRVSLDKDSREILEIRRNWREDDPNQLARKVFVKYPFVPAFGFYDIGLLHILGNADRALTAAWRLALDAGMFANFPGFLYTDVVARQQTNEFRVPPGGGVRINTGNKPIGDAITPLPYKDVTQGLLAIMKEIEDGGQRIGGTAELQVAEGRQEAPVGTTLAMIEQATKMLSAVHVRLHAAQAEEFMLLKERFREDPGAFWRQNKKPARDWVDAEFLQALDDYDLVPAADPNTPSHMHRIMKAQAIMQMAMAAPQLFNLKSVATRVMKMMGVDSQGLFAPPQQQGAAPPDPQAMAAMAKIQAQQQQTQLKAAELQQNQQAATAEQQSRQDEVNTESADRAADRMSRERVADTRDHTQKVKALAELVRDGILHPEILTNFLGVPPHASPITQAGQAHAAATQAASTPILGQTGTVSPPQTPGSASPQQSQPKPPSAPGSQPPT